MEWLRLELGKVVVETFFFFPIQNNQLDARGGSSGRLRSRYINGRIIDIDVLFKATSLLGTASHWRAEGTRAEDATWGAPQQDATGMGKEEGGKPRILWLAGSQIKT